VGCTTIPIRYSRIGPPNIHMEPTEFFTRFWASIGVKNFEISASIGVIFGRCTVAEAQNRGGASVGCQNHQNSRNRRISIILVCMVVYIHHICQKECPLSMSIIISGITICVVHPFVWFYEVLPPWLGSVLYGIVLV